MKKRNLVVVTAILFLLFIVYTAALIHIDVKPIGPNGSCVGFATVNQAVHQLLGVHMKLYNITDWLSIAAIILMLSFAFLGLVQLIKRKSLLRVDSSILVLGGFYLLVFAAYSFFECYIVNYRPVLIEGVLEASYPSSTTMLVLCVIPTAMMQFQRLIKSSVARTITNTGIGIFTAAMVMGRLVSGVHWFTDILGGVLLSAALVMLYYSVNVYIEPKDL
ncbi:MAG: phosphatase PAP2 family protein [Clostridiaceae bacterium]